MPNYEAQNFDFGEFVQLFKAEICHNLDFWPPKLSKKVFFEAQNLPKLISRKI